MEGEQRDARCRYFRAERRDSKWYMQPVKDTSGMGFAIHNSPFEETLEALERSVNRDVKRGTDTLYRVEGSNAHHGNHGYIRSDRPLITQKWEFMTSEFDQFKSLFVNSVQYVDAGDELSSLTDEEIEDRWYYASTKKSKSAPTFEEQFNQQIAKNRGKEKNRVVKRGKAPTPSNYADDDERARLAEYLENYNGYGGDKSLANAIAEWICPSSWD